MLGICYSDGFFCEPRQANALVTPVLVSPVTRAVRLCVCGVRSHAGNAGTFILEHKLVNVLCGSRQVKCKLDYTSLSR